MGDFENDLDEYLSARKKSSIKGVIQDLFSPKEKKVRIPEQVEVYNTGKEKKFSLKGVFTKKSDEQLIQSKLEAEEAVDDMKEIAKVALLAIKQLPDDQLSMFKQGPEFERLKQILKKHSLIK